MTTPKRGIGHQTLAALGEFAAQLEGVACSRRCSAESLHTALPRKAVEALHEFGRFANDLEYRARHTQGAEAARAFLLDWLKDIGYEQHLHDGEDQAKLADARWSNVLDFVDWIARRCGGEVAADGSGNVNEATSVMQVAQTISLMQSIAERGDDADQVTLSTLHAAKGLEWPHVMLVGVNEGLLPFSSEAEPVTAQRLEEERRLMYVGVTRARQTLTLSTLRRRKRGRETVPGVPSRFIAEMKLDEHKQREDPRERLKRVRAELAARSSAATAPVEPAGMTRAARVGCLRSRSASAMLAIANGTWALDHRALLFVFKPLTTLLIIAHAWRRGADAPAARRFVLAGLWFSLLGDVALMWPQRGFVPGLVAFLIAHVLYIVAFTREHRFAAQPAALAAYALIAGMILAFLWRDIPAGVAHPGGGLRVRADGDGGANRGRGLARGGRRRASRRAA